MIRNIWAVGRNYGDHAKELGNQVPSNATDPMIFLKAGTSAVSDGATFNLPPHSSNVHHELEVAFEFGSDLKLARLTLAIDLTARDVQDRLKSQGHPWTLAKSFREACLVGPLVPLPASGDLQALEFSLKINGEPRQRGTTSEMIHPIERVRSFVAANFPVAPGDLLLTGTPAGVGPVRPGDFLEAEIPGLVRATWRAAAAISAKNN